MAHRYDPVECCCPGCEARWQRWISKPANIEKLEKDRQKKLAAATFKQPQNANLGWEQ